MSNTERLAKLRERIGLTPVEVPSAKIADPQGMELYPLRPITVITDKGPVTQVAHYSNDVCDILRARGYQIISIVPKEVRDAR